MRREHFDERVRVAAQIVIAAHADVYRVRLEEVARDHPHDAETCGLLARVAKECWVSSWRKPGVSPEIMREEAALEIGPKGAVIAFKDNRFARPEKLVEFITKRQTIVTLRPDHRLVYRQDWADTKARMSGVKKLMQNLSTMAA